MAAVCATGGRHGAQFTAARAARPHTGGSLWAREAGSTGLAGQRRAHLVPRRQLWVALASAGGDGDGDSGGGDGDGAKAAARAALPKMALKLQFELLGTLLVRYPGVIGSVAVAAGYFLHLNALPLHWDSHDALLGLQCAAPVLALDALIMLPDYSPTPATKVIRLKAPRSVAERLRQREAAAGGQAGGTAAGGAAGEAAAGGQAGEAVAGGAAAPRGLAGSSREAGGGEAGGGAGEELVEVERTVSVRGDQHPALAALHRLQMEQATDNVGRLLYWPLELVLMLTWHLAEEMLYRAIVLTLAAGWTIDRLYEAGADETVQLLGWQLATPQAGALFAAIGCTTASLALLVQRAFFPLRLISRAEGELEASEAASKAGPDVRKQRARMRALLAKVRDGVVRQRRWSTAAEGARDVVEWASLSTSFLLTGNLLAPYVTSVASDLLFSSYQRLKARSVERSQAQALASIADLARTARVLSEARKDAVAPPTARRGPEGEQGAARRDDRHDDGGGGGGGGGAAEAADPTAAAAGEDGTAEAEKAPAAVGADRK